MNKQELFGYSVNLIRLAEEDGGGWFAEVPELKGCIADGSDPDQALNSLKNVVEIWLEVAQEEKKEIPSPRIYVDSEYSGKFTLRIPKTLHRLLAQHADREGVSLNQYVLSLVAYNFCEKVHLNDNSKNCDDLSRPYSRIIYEVYDKDINWVTPGMRDNPFNLSSELKER